MRVRRATGPGSPPRVLDPQISGLSSRPRLTPYRTARRGKKAPAGWARNPILGLQPVRTKRIGPGKSIRVTDPEISALSARPRPILFGAACWGAGCRPTPGWPRNTLAAPSPVRATCNRPGKSIRAADSQISTLSAQPGSDSLLDGSLGQTTLVGCRMGPKPCPGTLASTCDVQHSREVHPSHGSHDIRAFGPARFICPLDGLPGREMRTARPSGVKTRYLDPYVRARRETGRGNPSA